MALPPCVGRRRLGAADAAIPPHSTVLLVVDLTLAAWALVELGVRVRESVYGKGRSERDRGTRVLVALSLGVAVGTAVAARWGPSPPTSAPLLAAGLVLMWLGLALRVWSIAALASSSARPSRSSLARRSCPRPI